jgi:DNA-binding transcriptional MerR regulator|tara:strand:- start:55254 stop:55496 length:243 start_codon:yes stop_codon:yes gene_type:complete
MKKYLTVKETSELFGVTPLTLRNWDKSGKLAASRNPINNYRMYRREDIEELLSKIETSKSQPVKPTLSKKKSLKIRFNSE